MELDENGFLERNNVRLIGTTSETIKKAEDRLEFKMTMEKIGEPCAASKVVKMYRLVSNLLKVSDIRLYFVRLTHLVEAAVELRITEQNS